MSFDDSRIKHHPNKKLLADIGKYFRAFVTHDADASKAMQTRDYTMTNVALCVVHADRDAWYEVNKNFSQVGADMETIALSLDGSSAPGSKSVMENVNRYKLKFDAPPGSEDKLPPGAKAGDTVTMIIQSTIWWAEGGKVAREWEYGRLAWKGFTIDDWDRHSSEK